MTHHHHLRQLLRACCVNGNHRDDLPHHVHERGRGVLARRVHRVPGHTTEVHGGCLWWKTANGAAEHLTDGEVVRGVLAELRERVDLTWIDRVQQQTSQPHERPAAHPRTGDMMGTGNRCRDTGGTGARARNQRRVETRQRQSATSNGADFFHPMQRTIINLLR